MPCCTTPHIASRKSLMIFMSASRAARRGVAAPKYATSSAALGVRVELVVHGEVAEVEVAVVHARVLPVEQPEPVAVGEEVGAEQVVVTRARAAPATRANAASISRRVLGRAFDTPPGSRHRAPPRRRGARCGTRKQSKVPPSGPDSWKARTSAGTRRRAGPASASSLGAERGAGDEARDEAALGLEERDDLGRDPERRGARVGLPLDAPVDVEQLGLVAGEPQHEALAADLDEEVAVRDPALELASTRARPAQPGTRSRSASNSASLIGRGPPATAGGTMRSRWDRRPRTTRRRRATAGPARTTRADPSPAASSSPRRYRPASRTA